MKILIVEDDANSRVFLERALLSQGYIVESSANGVQALEKVVLSPPDLIISDIMMPEMDGFELCRKVKTDEHLRTIPFVFYTATFIEEKDEKLAMALGASRFLIKPMEPEAFFNAISGVIEEHLAGHLPVPDQLPAEMTELNRMQLEAYARKLDKKVLELEKEREALRESERKYRTLVENIPQKIFTKDRRSIYVSCNELFARDLGITPEEFTGKTDYDFFPKELADKYRHDDNRIMESGETEGIEEQYIHGGKKVWVYTVKTPIRAKDGNIAGMLGIFSDITERRNLEAQLLQAQKMEAVGQLAGGIAHDFNNILTAMIGYAHIIKMKMKEDDPLRNYADQILSLSDKAANLTQSLLSFSRKRIMNPEPVTLNEVIKRIDHLLSRIIGEDIHLQTMLSEEDLIVMADSGQIEQVLMNLATNARDAMPDGGFLTIGTEKIAIDEEFIKEHGFGKEGEYALLAVTDTGAGMDRETREKIFEPFFTTKEVGKGTGLGLSMVYGIIKQHDGYINVYSEPGSGTTFRIYLPLIKAKVEEIRPEVIQTVETGTETVLLAEDEEAIREFIKKMLEEYGYKVITAGSGQEAINEFKAHKDKIQLLLLDVIMPNKNGREAYEEIKKIRPDIRALFMSGYPADIINKHGILENGFAYIEKPASPAKLLKKIREVLGQ
jgi:PAS domain S-box-containing protein